jgi:hypothetical protein
MDRSASGSRGSSAQFSAARPQRHFAECSNPVVQPKVLQRALRTGGICISGGQRGFCFLSCLTGLRLGSFQSPEVGLAPAAAGSRRSPGMDDAARRQRPRRSRLDRSHDRDGRDEPAITLLGWEGITQGGGTLHTALQNGESFVDKPRNLLDNPMAL